MNPKVKNLLAEKEKNRQKIANLQAKNQEIDAMIKEIENTDIIGLVRENSMTPDMLAELIKSWKENEAEV